MEPNNSRSSAAGTYLAIADHGLSSAHAQNHLSPPLFLPKPSQDVVSASGSGSGSLAVGDGSLSVHGHATPQSQPSSFFPALGTVHTTGGDIFAQPEAPAAAAFPTPLGSQLWEGLTQPSSWTASGLPACPSAKGFSEFADQSALEQMATWQGDMPLFSQPWSSGFDNYDLAPLLASLSAPSLEEARPYKMSSTIGGSMPWQCGSSSSHSTGASSDFIGFTQPLSNSELAPIQAQPLLPVNQEPIDDSKDEQDQDAIPHSIPDAEDMPMLDNSTARDQSRETVMTLPEESTPCHDGSSSKDMDSSSSTPKLSMGAKKTSRADASSSRSNPKGVIFTDAEKETISKEEYLQELVNTDPKRVKRIISNRVAGAKRKAINDTLTLELERQVETMQTKCTTTSAELQLLKGRCAELETQHKDMSMMMKELERQALLKDAMSQTLQAQIQELKLIRHNAVQMSSKRIDGGGSHLNALHQQMSPYMVQLQQLQIQEQPSQDQQAQAAQQAQKKNDQFMGEQHHPNF